MLAVGEAFEAKPNPIHFAGRPSEGVPVQGYLAHEKPRALQ